MCKRLEHKMGEGKEVPTKTKVVRITYCDPDATDSSSDDDDDHYCYYNRLYFKPSQDVRIFPQKNILKKTFLQINLDAQNPNSTQVIMTKSQSVRRALPVGVRIRKSGRYGAEVREPFTKRRLWLGTFATPEEASRAYVAKKSEILMMKAKMKKKAGRVVLSANSSSGGADPVVGGGGEKDGHVDSYVRHKRTESFGENKVVEDYVGCENDEEVMGAWRMNESGNNFVDDCNGFCGFSSIGDKGSHLP